MTDHPTVLIVSGAWHGPPHYQPLADALAADGYPVLCPRNPTNTTALNAQEPRPTLASDAEAVRAELRRLIESEGKDVLLAPHSYGGLVALEAVEKTMAKSERLMQGKEGGVIGIVAMCSFLIPSGACLGDLADQKSSPFVDVYDNGMVQTKKQDFYFYNDLAPEKQEYYTALLVQQPASVHMARLTADPAAYKFLPTSYVICEQDNALPMPFQETVVEGVRKDGGQMRHVYRLESSHSPMISKPQEVVGIIGHFLDLIEFGPAP